MIAITLNDRTIIEWIRGIIKLEDIAEAIAELRRTEGNLQLLGGQN